MKYKNNTVDEYINHFPENTRQKLNELRKLILQSLPESEEKISYQIPAYQIHGVIIYFAAFKNHISLYAAPRNEHGFEELENYKGGKGTIQLPLDKDLPTHLITKIINYRKQNFHQDKTVIVQ